jgi:hypothetical protein
LTLAGVPLSSWSAWIHCCTAAAKWSLVLLLCMRGFRRSQPSKRQCTSQLSWLLTLCCAWFPLWFQPEIDRAEGIPLAHVSLAPDNKSSTRPRIEYGVITDTDLLETAKEAFSEICKVNQSMIVDKSRLHTLTSHGTRDFRSASERARLAGTPFPRIPPRLLSSLDCFLPLGP